MSESTESAGGSTPGSTPAGTASQQAKQQRKKVPHHGITQWHWHHDHHEHHADPHHGPPIRPKIVKPPPPHHITPPVHHDHKTELSFLEDFLLGGAAAVVSKTVAAPLERIKLLMQNQDAIIRQGLLDRPYTGVVDCTVRVFQTEGIIPFWRGNLANCIRYFPTQALNFAFKDEIKAAFHCSPADHGGVKLAKNVVSGGVAGTMSLTVVYSLDYARTRLANDAKSHSSVKERQFNGLVDVYRKTFRHDGMAGLYRGFVISCLGIFVYRGCYFGFYDTLKPVLLGEHPGFVSLFLLGYAITVVSEIAAYPIDTVRRRMMMTSGEKVKYKGSMDCLRQIVKKEGVMTLMKGTWANILRGVAGAGVLVGFDEFKDAYLHWKLG